MSRTIAWVASGFAVLVVLACMGLFLPLETMFFGVFGWAFYLWRVVPAVTVDRSGVITASVCFAGFLAGSHALLRWLSREINGDDAWRPRWTLAIGGMVVLMFVAGIAAAGVAHQVGWMLTTKDPLVEPGSPREAARRAQSTNNLKQLGLAVENYASSEGSYPPGASFDEVGVPMHGWLAALLPYIEEHDIHDRIDFRYPWDHPRNASAYRTNVWQFYNPGFREDVDADHCPVSHYAGNARVLGGDRSLTPATVTDGAAQTILGGEVGGRFRPWGDPRHWRDPALGINRSPDGFGGPFKGGASLVFLDGSVRFIKQSVDPKVLGALATPAGGEAVQSEQY